MYILNYMVNEGNKKGTDMAADTKKLRVTFITKDGKYENVETFDLTPHANGFVPDYQLRAKALNWLVKNVEEVG